MNGDRELRERALSPERSFLVQAPAGSGKTELLTQRVLRLLATVDEPEEIVALTFTRKAAAEMRARIVAALRDARDLAAQPQAEHERLTRRLAEEALWRDDERDWQLAAHPSRLRVLTLDALCGSLTRQMPLLSHFGSQPAIADDPDSLYREAARRTLAELEQGHHWSASVERLLLHLNNDLARVESLLAAMLERRDQWLRFVADRADPRTRRENLEQALAGQIERSLEHVCDLFPADAVAELAELARFAAKQTRAQELDTPLLVLTGMRELPDPDGAGLPQWRALVWLLLTGSGQWRRRVDRRQGFPAASAGDGAEQQALFAQRKEQFDAVIERLMAVPGLREALVVVAALPPPNYRESQWQVLASLFDLLKLAAGYLQVVFGERGAVDFIEMAARASQALGEPEAPTDLALAMDYRLSHLLVDEFQDTSLTQFRFLEKLVAGWQSGDGRTVFLVGDPMQSIYRFRQAEVGLFLRAKRGLGDVPLEFCRLRENFRSRPAIVDWVNRVFPQVMPAHEDLAAGAIAYAPAEAQREADEQAGVHLHPQAGMDADLEAERVVELLQRIRSRHPQASMAVLVRSRRHVAALVPKLNTGPLSFQAVEIEALGERPVVHDLLALTRCLLHPADRLSWLAVLRAPWCGLSLADLLVVSGEARQPVWPRLNDATVQAGLSEDGRKRAVRFCAQMRHSLAQRSRRSLRRWVEGTWLALGGPAAVYEQRDLADAGAFFDLLDGLDEGGDLADFAQLEERVAGLFAPPDATADGQLQIMTLHKAKGLEFDHVIVPGLGRATAADSQPLLFWLELPDERADRPGAAELLLAPISGAGESDEPIYNYLKSLDREKTRLEDARLLYVAATRAREQLHLFGHVKMGEDGPRAPGRGSLLERLWPALEEEFSEALPETQAVPESAQGQRNAPPIHRLTADWTLIDPPPSLPVRGLAWADSVTGEQEVRYEWAGSEARHVGTAVHEVLMQIAREGLAAWSPARLRRLKPALSARLTALGIPSDRVGKFANQALSALEKMLADERGRWLLAQHSDGVSEYPVTGNVDGELVNAVIDRSFVDEAGTRWIVDYKTGQHEGGNREAFLDREAERYRAQLQTYARLMAGLDERPIRLGLYFPMLCGWREWAS